MFPTLSHLIYYLTGVRVPLPVQTFGFFMVLAFAGAYLAFQSEYRRKERLGIIHPFTQKRPGGGQISLSRLLFSGLAGFVGGAKIWYILKNPPGWSGDLQGSIFSFRGSLVGGLLTAAVTVLAIWLWARRVASVSTSSPDTKPALVAELIHPWQLMDRLLLFCGLSGFAGALLFAKAENLAGLAHDPLHWLTHFDGLNYYGALIFGALTYLYINWRYRIPLPVAADIGSPGMMLAYAIGRMGCHLAGDGDWGIVNNAPQPHWLSWMPSWAWGFRYPHNVLHQGSFIPGCMDNYCMQLPAPVYPTSLYESVICLLLFALLWGLRRRIAQPGLLFGVFALLNGTERFLIEFIRVNPRYSFLGWRFSQSQFIALLWIGIGLYFFTLMTRNRGKKEEV